MTIREQLNAARRELAMRERVYPRWVQQNRMTQSKAYYEVAAMKAIVATSEGMVNQPIALVDVMAERGAQDARWGVQNHDPMTYLTILMEEVGELSQEALRSRFGPIGKDGTAGLTQSFRAEAVQVSAVGLAIVECVDRGAWRWPMPACRVEETCRITRN